MKPIARRPTHAVGLATAACALLLALAPAAAAERLAPPSPPRNVIFLIGDGFGPAHVALARGVAGRPLAFDPHLVGAAFTGSNSSRVTDSGAAATALASGIHTANSAIGVDAGGRPRRTILEAAEARGLATGLVATSRITHATPAAFAAHVADRGQEDAIAVQLLGSGVDVALGGGARHFLPRPDGGRRDGRDLVREAARRGVVFVSDAAGLRAAPAGPLLGLFAPSHMAYALDRDTLREPALDEMAAVAIERLARDPDGFFLMVEGSRIDHASHQNDAAAAAREALEFERAFEVALAFAARDGGTLVVATADHETGGLSLGREVGGRSLEEWRPELLRAARASAEALAARIRAGESATSALASAGLRDLTASERAALRSPGTAGRAAVVGRIVSERARVGWTTLGHTAVDVPVWAYGPGADRFRGAYGNDELGRRIAAALGLRIGDPLPAADASDD